MAGLLASLGAGAAEGLVGGVGKIIDNLHTSEAEKAEAKLKAAALAQTTLDSVLNVAVAELAAQKEVLVAELQQGDAYTKRARPTLVYGGLLFIGINYVAFPIMGRLVAMSQLLFSTFDPLVAQQLLELAKPLADLPEGFWYAWGGVTGGWVIGRSLERGGVVNAAMEKMLPKQ